MPHGKVSTLSPLIHISCTLRAAMFKVSAKRQQDNPSLQSVIKKHVRSNDYIDTHVELKTASFTREDILRCITAYNLANHSTSSPDDILNRLLAAKFICKTSVSRYLFQTQERFYFSPLAPTFTISSNVITTADVTEKALGVTKDRRLSLLVGAFVADAAASSMNGKIVSNSTRSAILSTVSTVEFHVIQRNSSRLRKTTAAVGEMSPFGREAFILLSHLSRHRGVFHAATYAQEWYAAVEKLRPSELTPLSQDVRTCMEKGFCYPHSGVISDLSIDFLSRVVIIVAIYAGYNQKTVESIVRECVAIHQPNTLVTEAAVCACRLLTSLLLNPEVSFQNIMQRSTSDTQVQQIVLKVLNTPGRISAMEAARRYGIGTSIPGAFQTTLTQVQCSLAYDKTIRANIMAGGACAGRSIFLGACSSAVSSTEVVPPEWKKLTKELNNVKALFPNAVVVPAQPPKAMLLLPSEAQKQLAPRPLPANTNVSKYLLNNTSSKASTVSSSSSSSSPNAFKKVPYKVRGSVIDDILS